MPTKKSMISGISNLFNKDSWANVFTGRGMQNRDKRTGGYFAKNYKLGRDELANLYIYDGMSKRVVDVKIEDMTREGYHIINDIDDLILKASRNLKFFRCLREAITWQEVFGGSLIVMIIDDDQDLDQPLNENNIRKIDSLKVFDRYQIHLSASNLYDNPSDENYGEPKTYPIYPDGGMSPFEVHETRVLRFDGILLPTLERVGNQYWHDSPYQAYFERLRGIGNTYTNIETIIEEFIIGKLKISNLENLIQTDGANSALNRLHLLDMSKHILNTLLLDENEDFERISANVTGLEELTTKIESALSAITGIPVSRLFGQSPKGLNAAGQENMQLKSYYDMIDSKRENDMKKQIERFNYLLMKSKEGPTKGQYHDDWIVEFPPLWQPTEQEQAQTRKLHAETDKIYIETEVLTPEEVATSHFGGIDYDSEITLSEAHTKFIETREKMLGKAAINGVFENKEEKENEKGME